MGYFKGYYFKHQKGDKTFAIIPGTSDSGSFIQAITNNRSYNYTFPDITFGKEIIVGKNRFGFDGIEIDTENIKGSLAYTGLTPLKYDIMGPFSLFPMECRHGILSLHHKLSGQLTIDGENYDFNNGTGYIEMDSGTSFPKRYLWIQCNDFHDYHGKSCIFASIADIPFMGFNFLGCICIVFHNNKEYRFATYKGVKILHHSQNGLVLQQGRYRLEIDISMKTHSPLYAPIKGQMTNIIHESNNSQARFRLYKKNILVMNRESSNVSFEYCF